MHELGEAAHIWVYLKVFETFMGVLFLMIILGLLIWGSREKK